MASLTDCGLCLDEFTEPRQLPCTHTYCTGCLDELIRSNAITVPPRGRKKRGGGGSCKEIECPECREKIKVCVIINTLFIEDYTDQSNY